MVEIPLTTTEKLAIIDDEDNDLLNLKWYFHNPNGVYSTNKRPVKLIRVIAERKLGRPLKRHEKCRHISGNKLDNRRNNVEVIPPPPIINGKQFTSSLSEDKFTTLDIIDIDLSLVKWSFSPTGYACRNIGSSRNGSKIIYLHRVILERILDRPLVKDEQVDHISGNRLDNRRSNLRISTHSQNAKHQTAKIPNTSSVYKGVHWSTRLGKWKSQIKNDGILYHAGFFNEEIEAARAYDVAAAKYHKDFAAFNFPDEWRWDTSINQWIRT